MARRKVRDEGRASIFFVFAVVHARESSRFWLTESAIGCIMRQIRRDDARLLQEVRGLGLPDKLLRACDCRVQDRGELDSLRTPRWSVRGAMERPFSVKVRAILSARCREP